jgi:hypothetical protein
MAQARFSGPRGSAPQFSANAVDENAADKAINAKMILTVTITGLVSISAGPNGYPCSRGDRRNTARTAPSVMATMAKVGEIVRWASRYAINFLYNQ